MKHVSRVLFGFSIVAVLALFTACPQANDSKTSTKVPALKSVSAAATANVAGGVTLKMGAPTIDAKNYDKVKITVAKVNGKTTEAAQFVLSSTSKDSIEIAKDDFATQHLTDATGYTAVVANPTAGATYQFTFQLYKKGTPADTKVGNAATTTSQLGTAGSATPAPAIGDIVMTAGSNNHEVNFTSVAVNGDASAYTAVKVTAAKKGSDKKPVKIDGNLELLIEKANIATAKTLTLSKNESNDAELQAGEDYTFTFQLVNASTNVGDAKTVTVQSGKKD